MQIRLQAEVYTHAIARLQPRFFDTLLSPVFPLVLSGIVASLADICIVFPITRVIRPGSTSALRAYTQSLRLEDVT